VILSDGVYRIHDLSPGEPFDVETGLQFYHPEDRPQVERDIERAVSDGKPYEHEVRLITATGRERWVHAVGEPVTEDGDVVELRGVFQDVTERNEHERELTRQNDRMEEFADIVSHDLRSPLAVAEGHPDRVRDDCESEHLADAADAMERARTRVDDV